MFLTDDGVQKGQLTSANELAPTLVWKPKQVKGLALKTFYANRTSEYDGFVNPRTGKRVVPTRCGIPGENARSRFGSSHWEVLTSDWR